MCVFACLQAIGMLWGKAFRRLMSNKAQATPLGRIEPVRVTEEEYKRMQTVRYRKKNIGLILLLLTGVLSVYGYSMYAVKQDPLLLDELLLDENENSNTSTTANSPNR